MSQIRGIAGTGQSKKVREYYAKKQAEEVALENHAKEQLEILKQANPEAANVVFYKLTVSKCIEFLNSKQIMPVVNILKRLETEPNYHNIVTSIITDIFPYADLFFFRCIRDMRRDYLNSVETFIILHNSVKPELIVQLLEYKILDMAYATVINGMDSLQDTIYLFMQLTDYEDSIKNKLFCIYSDILSEQGFLDYIMLCHIPHEVAIYLKGLNDGKELTEKHVNIYQILQSYRVMEASNPGSPAMKGRMINLIRMVVDGVLNRGLILPKREEFIQYFNKIYKNTDTSTFPAFLQDLSWDTHWHIDIEIIKQRAIQLFPYEGDGDRWA